MFSRKSPALTSITELERIILERQGIDQGVVLETSEIGQWVKLVSRVVFEDGVQVLTFKRGKVSEGGLKKPVEFYTCLTVPDGVHASDFDTVLTQMQGGVDRNYGVTVAGINDFILLHQVWGNVATSVPSSETARYAKQILNAVIERFKSKYENV